MELSRGVHGSRLNMQFPLHSPVTELVCKLKYNGCHGLVKIKVKSILNAITPAETENIIILIFSCMQKDVNFNEPISITMTLLTHLNNVMLKRKG